MAPSSEKPSPKGEGVVTDITKLFAPPTMMLELGDMRHVIAYTEAQRRGYTASISDDWTTTTAACDLETLAPHIWRDQRGTRSESLIVARLDHVALIQINRQSMGLSLFVFARTMDEAKVAMDGYRQLMPQAASANGQIDVTFWYSTSSCPRSYERQLNAQRWSDIADNYPAKTHASLDRLLRYRANQDGGKLVLWRGMPGTGKTFALRALAQEWREWCRIHYVLDPENFFQQGDYLLNVILGGDDEYDDSYPAMPFGNGQAPEVYARVKRWRLVVLEDTGELLSKDAKQRAGQGLSRLLNLCDGLLGQGLRVLVLVTTNEDIGTLHEAVSRPGRCLAQVPFDPFGAEAANAWLTQRHACGKVSKNTTLAEMYAMARGDNPLQASRVIGFADTVV